jgi:esterase FrsA
MISSISATGSARRRAEPAICTSLGDQVMSFTFPIDSAALAAERAAQFAHLGVPDATAGQVRERLGDFWAAGPGGWAFEWSQPALAAEARGAPLEAAILYGVARFPCLASEAHREAHARQLGAYRRAFEAGPVDGVGLTRRELVVAYRGGMTRVPVHLLALDGVPPDAPLLLVMGGVDTWKMDVHHAGVAFGRAVGARVVLVDMPGTGESTVPLAHDSDVILRGVIDQLRHGATVGYVGFSFSGHWAAKLALAGAVDAGVAIGGLIAASFERDNVDRLPEAMVGIIGNALGCAALPSRAALLAGLEPFSLSRQGLLQARAKSPLFVANGDQDPYVPLADVTLFEGRASTEVRVAKGAGHCAAERMGALAPEMSRWLRAHLR